MRSCRELIKQLCQKLENAPRNLGAETDGAGGEQDIVAKLERHIVEVTKFVITARSETNRVIGKVDKSYVQVPEYS